MTMTHARQQEMLRSVPANAAKVYDVVPISESWSYSQIHQEMQRQSFNIRQEVLMGCVVRLKEAGLIYEPIQSRFQRVPYKPPTVLRTVTSVSEEPSMAVIAHKPQQPTPSLVDQLGDFSAKLRNLANDLDIIALSVEEQSSKTNAELERLRQLKLLLKGLGE